MMNRFVVAHRPYERLKLRVGINTGPVIAGVQVKVHIIKIIGVKIDLQTIYICKYYYAEK